MKNVKLKVRDGEFIRTDSNFRNWITADGSPGESGIGGFSAEPGRYHLYISHACPWAHRALIFRKLKGLESLISLSIVHPLMPAESWVFDEYPGSTEDHLYGFKYLYQLYQKADINFNRLVTVPVLWDKLNQTIVNNESSEIIRMMNSSFNDITGNKDDYYPAPLREEIDAINTRVYKNVNNGVYRCGFATSQKAYDRAITPLFETLDWLESILDSKRYLTGNAITEADWRLFTTLIRFDPVYVGHFKCNIRRIADYPCLSNYLRDLYQQPGIASTVNMEQIKKHYYESHESVNPSGVIPQGPEIDLNQPHNRK
ncbi:MAG: glutathione S-transferase family protein [Woeseiaceae bacterium]|nr:glutathione S-transferase family protein [Woeseiaceae bacterium]